MIPSPPPGPPDKVGSEHTASPSTPIQYSPPSPPPPPPPLPPPWKNLVFWLKGQRSQGVATRWEKGPITNVLHISALMAAKVDAEVQLASEVTTLKEARKEVKQLKHELMLVGSHMVVQSTTDLFSSSASRNDGS